MSLLVIVGLLIVFNSTADAKGSFSYATEYSSATHLESLAADHDDPEGALEIPYLSTWCSSDGEFTTKGMKGTDLDISCAKNQKSENDVWFKFQAAANTIELSAIPFGKDAISKHSISLYDENLAELNCGSSSKDGVPAKVISTELIVGAWYFVRIDNEDKKEGSFTLCIKSEISNDFQIGATEIPHAEGWCSSPGSLSLLGMSPAGEPMFCEKEKKAVRDAWFTFQATESTIELNAIPSGDLGIAKHRIALYDASNNQISCGSQAEKEGPAKLMSTVLITGAWYYVRIDSDDKKKGDFELCISTEISNDFKEGAIELPHQEEFCSSNAPYTTKGMTPQGEAMSCAKDKEAQSDVWFSFEATTEFLEFFLYPSGENPINEFFFGLYDIDNNELICEEQQEEDIPAKFAYDALEVGKGYFIRIDNKKDKSGDFDICMHNKLGYDFQVGAKELVHQPDWYSPPGTTSTLGMTPQGEKIGCLKEKETQNDVWFAFTATTNELELEVIPTGELAIDKMVVALYDEQLTEFSCEKQPGKKQKIKIVQNDLILNQRYFVRIDNEEGKAGDFMLRLRNQFSYDLRAGAMEIPHASDWCSPEAVFSTMGMTPEGAAISCSKENESQNDVWFSFQATTEVMQLELVPIGDSPVEELSAALYNEADEELSCASFHEKTSLIKMAYEALIVGQWYVIRIDNGKDGSGDFNLCLRNEITYDFAAGAQQVPHTDDWCSSESEFSTLNMTPGNNKLSCNDEKDSQSDVWFKFQASKESLEVEVISAGDQPIGTMVAGLYDSELNELECAQQQEGLTSVAISFADLIPGSWYFIQLDNAKGGQGDFQLCVRGGEVIPDPPADLTVTYDVGNSYNLLSWTDQATNELGFIIERSINGGSFEFLDSIPMNLITYQDIDIQAGFSYAYRISSQNYTGASAFSNEDFAIVQADDQLDPVIQEYDEVLYVNQLGNNALAKISDPSKPWATPHVASVFAHTLNQTENQRYLVYVQRGTYNDLWINMPGIDMYFEEDAVVWYNTDNENSRSIISDWRGGAGTYRVLGNGRFYVTTVQGGSDRDAVNFRYNSNLETFEFKEINSHQFWSGFINPVVLKDGTIRSPSLWYSTGSAITYEHCTFSFGYHMANGVGHRTFDNCTFILPDLEFAEESLKVLDHNGDYLFTMNFANYIPDINTADLTEEEVASLSLEDFGNRFPLVASFEIQHRQNPFGGWHSRRFNFSYELNNPTFSVERSNGVAVRVIWNENNSTIDYAGQGIAINGGQAVAGADVSNPILFQADKFDSEAADIPINIINAEYAGFTERIYRTNYTPMNVDLESNFYSIASGEWHDPAIWSRRQNGSPANSVPYPSSNIFIDGHNVDITQDTDCKNVYLNNQFGETRLDVSDGLLSVFGVVKLENQNPSNKKCSVNVFENGRLKIDNE